MTKKDKDPIQEFNQQAEKVKKKIPNNRVKIADPDDREPLSEEERSGKKAKEPEQNEEQAKEKPKNQLARIPYRVEHSYLENAKSEEDLESDEPPQVLARQLESGEISPLDLSTDDKMLVVYHLKYNEKMTGNEIAERLKMSRRSVTNYAKEATKHNAKRLSEMSTWEYGGEMFAMGEQALMQALKLQKPQQAAWVMKTMTELLQSLGLLYQQPNRSQIQQQIAQDINIKGGQGYSKTLQRLQQEGQEVNFTNVLEELMNVGEEVDEGKNGEGSDDG